MTTATTEDREITVKESELRAIIGEAVDAAFVAKLRTLAIQPDPAPTLKRNGAQGLSLSRYIMAASERNANSEARKAGNREMEFVAELGVEPMLTAADFTIPHGLLAHIRASVNLLGADPVIPHIVDAARSMGYLVDRTGILALVTTVPDVVGKYTLYYGANDGDIGSITVDDGGMNYVAATTTVTISGGGGSGATAEPVIVGGVITDINVTARGMGFRTAPTVTIADTGGGTGAMATAVVVPLQPTADFLGEGTAPPEASPAFVGVDLDPMPVAGEVLMSSTAILAAGISLEDFFVNEVQAFVDEKVGAAVMVGPNVGLAGAADPDAPTGIFNTAGVQSIPYGPNDVSFTRADVRGLRRQLLDNLAAGETFAAVLSSGMWQLAGDKVVEAGDSRHVYEGGYLDGIPAVVHPSFQRAGSVNPMVMGYFDRCVVPFWGGIDVIVDRVTSKNNYIYTLVQHMNVGVVNPKNFVTTQQG